MLQHYLIMALRHFRQHKVTTAINVLCLALGLTCFVVAWGVTAYWGKSDSYHLRASRTYVATWQPTQSDNSPAQLATPPALAEQLATDFPELEAASQRVMPMERTITVNGRSSFARVAAADVKFLRIFNWQMLVGDDAALDTTRSMVVSDALAQRLFGTNSVVGRRIRIDDREDVTITGVLAPIRQPSHLTTQESFGSRFVEAIVSMDTYAALSSPLGITSTASTWEPGPYVTYVVLPEDGPLTATHLNNQLDQFSQRHAPSTSGGHPRFKLRHIAEYNRVDSDRNVGAHNTGISSATLLQALGALILLVACINYANLATAQAATRSKDVALRKVVGASRSQVLLQYLLEASILTVVALTLSILGLGLVAFASSAETSAGLSILFLTMPQFWMVLAAVIVAVTLAAGCYPAFVLARIRPIHALCSGRSPSRRHWLTSTLIGLQFGFASILLIAALVVIEQTAGLKLAVWNPASDPIVVIANNLARAKVDPQLLQAELRGKPGVQAVTATRMLPWVGSRNVAALIKSPDAQGSPIFAVQHTVDHDFFATLDIPLIAGRVFARDRIDDAQLASDSTVANRSVVMDRSLAVEFGFTQPQDAIGQIVFSRQSLDDGPPTRLHIVGVVADKVITPAVGRARGTLYLHDPTTAAYAVIRLAKNNVAAALASIDQAWRKLAPTEPLTRRFADEQFEYAFKSLYQQARVLTAVASFAIVIAILGLFGMALHVVRRRTHEIGVRKTLGASVQAILIMLLRDFAKPVVIANIAVWPIAYLLMRGFVEGYANNQGLTPTPFVLSLGLILCIAWLAVVVQAIKAARMNPAPVLRYE